MRASFRWSFYVVTLYVSVAITRPAQAQTAGAIDTTLVEATGQRWLHLGLEHRTRAEWLADDFRAASTGDAWAVSFRTSLSAGLELQPVRVDLELLDARVSASHTALLNNTHGNALDVLQLAVAATGNGLLADNDHVHLRAGRMTMDVGSRRLIARNAFRNTINAFFGVDVDYRAGDLYLRSFALAPVVRNPQSADGVRDNAWQLDEHNFHAPLLGAFVSAPLALGVVGEALALGLFETDSATVASSDRQLATLALRTVRKPRPGAFDFDVEAMLQGGRSRATNLATDTTDLWHAAAALHVEAGISSAMTQHPRLSALFDFASGDASTKDANNNRFDPLFAARRFDFGPSGLFGPLARSNLVSPGVRVELWPTELVELAATYRAAWLASATDTWVVAARTNTDGQPFIGHVVDAFARVHVRKNVLTLEAGVAALANSSVVANTEPQHDDATTRYGYGQITVRL